MVVVPEEERTWRQADELAAIELQQLLEAVKAALEAQDQGISAADVAADEPPQAAI
jgi:hypothetical protein